MFGNLIQNSTQITAFWSKSQREEEFQYGGRLFFQTESSYISARKLLHSGQNRKGKKNSNMADVCFSKPKVVISQP